MHLSTRLIELHFIRLCGWVLPTTNKVSHKSVCSIRRTHTSLSCFTMCFVLKNELFRAGFNEAQISGLYREMKAWTEIQGLPHPITKNILERRAYQHYIFRGFLGVSAFAQERPEWFLRHVLSCLRDKVFRVWKSMHQREHMKKNIYGDKNSWKLLGHSKTGENHPETCPESFN